jgi:hypothetical protein
MVEVDGEEVGRGEGRIVVRKRKMERMLLRLSESIWIVDLRCSMK